MQPNAVSMHLYVLKFQHTQVLLGQTRYTALCRYVRYYADTVQHGPPKGKLLQLRRVAVSGLSDDDLNDIVVTVKLRPPGAGWDTDLVCLAAVKHHKHFVDGQWHSVCLLANSFQLNLK